MNLLNCYSSLQPQIHPNKLKQNTEKITNSAVRKVLESIKLKFKKLSVSIEPMQKISLKQMQEPSTQAKISFSLLVSSNFNAYDYCLDFEINLALNTIIITSVLLKDGMLLHIKDTSIRHIISRHCLELNGRSNNLSLRHNPIEGIVKFLYSNHVTQSQMIDFIKHPKQFSDNLEEWTNIIVGQWNTRIIYKILHLLNQLPDRIEPQREKINATLHKQIMSIKHQIKEISEHINYSHIEYPFFFTRENLDIKFLFTTQDKKEKKKVSQFNKGIAYYNFNSKKTAFCPDISRIISKEVDCMYEHEVKDFKIYSRSQIQIFKGILQVKNYTNCPSIMTPITVYKINGDEHMTSGGFGAIHRMLITAKLSLNPDMNPEKQQDNPKTEMVVVKKVANQDRIWWERSVIRQFGRGSCYFIQKYYDPQPCQELRDSGVKFNDCLIMDYSQQKSLNLHLHNFDVFVSFQTKLSYLFQITMGLRFLRDFGIVHLDLKPENVLLKIFLTNTGQNLLLLRLIDFGQSYISSSTNTINRGFTLPYASPQILKRDKKQVYNEKSDVFSLGVMMLCMLFDLNITEVKRIGLKPYESEEYLRLYTMCFEKSKYYGPEPIMLCLLNLAYKCIRPAKRERPLLDWICIIIKELLAIIEFYYK